MNKIILAIILISVVSISEGLANQNKATPPMPAESPIKSSTRQVTHSEVCSDLLNKYSDPGKRNPELVIYGNSNYKIFPINEVDDALTYYLSHKEPDQAIVLYVHGRALEKTNIGEYDREPDESKTDVIPMFSSKYNVKTTLMLHWPHRKPENKFPADDAKFAGNALACVIQRLRSENFNVSKFPGFRALITHSMGALVLEEALNRSSENLHEFDVVSIFAAASRTNNAQSWLSRLRANKKYVVINTKDFILKEVKDITKSIPLGMCGSECFNENQLPKDVVYLDITDIAGMLQRRHNYFVEDDVADKIVTKILKGENPPMGIMGNFENHRIIRKGDI